MVRSPSLRSFWRFHRVVTGEDAPGPGVEHVQAGGVGEDVEAVRLDGLAHLVGDVRRVGGGLRDLPAPRLIRTDLGHLVGVEAVGEALGAVAVGGGDVRPDPARAEHGDPDLAALGGELEAQRLAQRHDRGLGRVVGAHAGQVIEAGRRRRVDDVADVVGAQVRQEGPEAVDHAEEVDGEDPFEVLQRQLGDGQAAAADAGVVADQVDVAEVLERVAARAMTSASRLTSVGTVSTSAPACLSASPARCSTGRSMSPSTSFMPSAANRWAIARPMPDAPPVMTTTLPARCSMVAAPTYTRSRYAEWRRSGLAFSSLADPWWRMRPPCST